MTEPTVRTSRLAIAGALLAALAVGGAGFFAGRTTAPHPTSPPPVVIEAPPPPPPAPKETLERADIIRLAQQAADASASGTAMPDSVTKAGGRHFDLVIPFGCAGPSDAAAGRPMTWRYDADEQTLRVSIAPVNWQGGDWGLDGQADMKAARGFWIARPWSSSGACPPRPGTSVPVGVEAITLPGQTLAIAQFFSPDAERAGWRGGRPFEIVQRIEADRFQAKQGLRLRVKGRIDNGRRGGPVRCVQPGGSEQRPICALMVQMEDIQVELPATGEVLGTWSVDR